MKTARLLSIALLFLGTALLTAQNRKSGGGNAFNLLSNGDFAAGLREWDATSWKQSGKIKIDPKENYRGKPALRMECRDPDHAMANQIITVKPNTKYRITAMAKAQSIQFHEKGEDGACLGIRGTYERSEQMPSTFDWRKITFEFDSKDRTTVEIGPHLGWHASVVTGTAWFAEIEMVQL